MHKKRRHKIVTTKTFQILHESTIHSHYTQNDMDYQRLSAHAGCLFRFTFNEASSKFNKYKVKANALAKKQMQELPKHDKNQDTGLDALH